MYRTYFGRKTILRSQLRRFRRPIYTAGNAIADVEFTLPSALTLRVSLGFAMIGAFGRRLLGSGWIIKKSQRSGKTILYGRVKDAA